MSERAYRTLGLQNRLAEGDEYRGGPAMDCMWRKVGSTVIGNKVSLFPPAIEFRRPVAPAKPAESFQQWHERECPNVHTDGTVNWPCCIEGAWRWEQPNPSSRYDVQHRARFTGLTCRQVWESERKGEGRETAPRRVVTPPAPAPVPAPLCAAERTQEARVALLPEVCSACGERRRGPWVARCPYCTQAQKSWVIR